MFPFRLSHLSTHVPAPSGSGSSESASGMHLLVLGKQLRPITVRAVRTSTFRAYSRPPWSRVQCFMVAKQPASQLVVCRAGGEPLALLDGQKGAAG